MKALILLALMLHGCVGLGARESSVMLPDGKLYRVRCQSDGKLDYSDGVVKIAVDNNGPVGQVWAAGTAALGKTHELIKEAAK